MKKKETIVFRYPTVEEAERWAETQASLLSIYYGQQQTALLARQGWIIAAWSVVSTLGGLLFVVPFDTSFVQLLVVIGFFAALPIVAWRLFVFSAVEDLKVFRIARKLASIEKVQIWAKKRHAGQKDTIDYIVGAKSKKLNTWHGILAMMLLLQSFLLIVGLIRLGQSHTATREYLLCIVTWGVIFCVSIAKLPRSRTKYYYSLYGYARIDNEDFAAEAKSNSLGEKRFINGKIYYVAEGDLYNEDIIPDVLDPTMAK
jgi:hypothetical protein